MKERMELFTVLMAKIGRNIRKIKNQEMSEYSLRGPHVFCIYYLYTLGSLTVTELADRCEEDKATISRAVDYLVEEKIIDRPDGSAKRYNARLSLTEKGKGVGKEISHRVDFVLAEAGAGLGDEERASFYQTLNTISENLERLVKTNKKII